MNFEKYGLQSLTLEYYNAQKLTCGPEERRSELRVSQMYYFLRITLTIYGIPLLLQAQ